jgi:hypothetical protein
MLDIEDDDALAAVCRDETCELDYIHPSHVFPLKARKPGRPERPWWDQRDPDAHRRHDVKGLRESIWRAFAETDWPIVFCDLVAIVRSDYGSVSERSLHRQLAMLLKRRKIAVIDLSMFHGYIRRDSPRRADHDDLREYLEARHLGVLVSEAHRWPGIGLGVQV